MHKLSLTPERALLDPNFESYKLSLDSLPTYSTSDSDGLDVHARSPNEDQYSFLHAKLFGQNNNLLVSDPFTDGGDAVHVVDPQAGRVLQVSYGVGGGAPPQVSEVWRVPSGLKPTQAGDYNPSLVFATNTLAVYADGSGMVFILDTGDRKGSVVKWKSVFHEEICGSNRPFVVISAVASETTGEADLLLNALMQYVEAKDKVEGYENGDKLGDNVNFVNVVEWMTFAASGPTCWGLDRVRRFVFPGGVDYAQLTASASHLVCCTNKPFAAVFDSTGTLEEDVDTGNVQRKDAAVRPPFYWQQNVEDFLLWVVLPEDANKREIKVILKPRELTVSYKGKNVVSGRTWDVLDSGSLTWTIHKGKMEIELCKTNVGMIWQRFLAHGTDDDIIVDGEEVMDPRGVDLIEQEFKEKDAAQKACKAGDPLPAYNAQELEECDALPDDAFMLYVVDAATAANKATHKADLSGHQWLFNLQTNGSLTQTSVCLRHDVDGLVWNLASGEAERVSLSHIGTFSAMGYVQASKQQRKFSVAAPDLSYVAICDRSRHVYVYRQPADMADGCDLRNRKTGQSVKQISKQQVITLECSEEVQGAAASEKALFILTTNRLFVAQIRC